MVFILFVIFCVLVLTMGVVAFRTMNGEDMYGNKKSRGRRY
jgi:hypothetical protein